MTATDGIESPLVGNRKINVDSLAIQYGLKCSIPGIRNAARDYITRVARRHRGNIDHIVDTLGIDRKTYYRWRQEHDDIERIHQEALGLDRD